MTQVGLDAAHPANRISPSQIASNASESTFLRIMGNLLVEIKSRIILACVQPYYTAIAVFAQWVGK
jgi:hypothetical protein